MEFRSYIWIGVFLVGAYLLYSKRVYFEAGLKYLNNTPHAGLDARKKQWVLGQGYSGRWECVKPNNSGGDNLILDSGIIVPNVDINESFRWIGDKGHQAAGSAVLLCNKTLEGKTLRWELFVQPDRVDEIQGVLRKIERDNLNIEYDASYDKERSLAEKKLLDYSKLLSQIKMDYEKKPAVEKKESETKHEYMGEEGSYREEGMP